MPSNDTLLTFPCEFVLKIFGLATDEFLVSAKKIVLQHVPDLDDQAFVARPSKDGKYTALSVSFVAQSKVQLDAIYQALTTNPHVLMTL